MARMGIVMRTTFCKTREIDTFTEIAGLLGLVLVRYRSDADYGMGWVCRLTYFAFMFELRIDILIDHIDAVEVAFYFVLLHLCKQDSAITAAYRVQGRCAL